MALVPFAKPSDLKILAPAVTDEYAELVLDLVSGTIRNALGWNVDKEVDAVYTKVIPAGQTYLDCVVLPALNLTSIKSNGVVVDGITLASTEYDATSAGVVYLKVLAWQTVSITYTAGYQRAPLDTAPPVLRSVALDYASRMLGNPSGVRSYAMGGTAETFGEDISTLAADDERLDPFRVTQ